MIIGIDPSYTSTGLAIVSDDLKEIYHMSHFGGGYKVYDGRGYAMNSRVITARIFDTLIQMSDEHPGEAIHIVCEMPVFNSPSGCYLAVLHGYLDNLFETAAIPIKDYVFVPPTLCNSVIKNKSRAKTFISDWALNHFPVGKKRLNNDIATAFVFCHVYPQIINGEYTKVFYRCTRDF